jgi:hypothetical protein
MRVFYIAAPFRASNAWEIEQNIRQAEEAALEIWRMGAAVICPHTNTRFFQGAAPDEVWLAGDLEILRRCDAIYMVGGWSNSSGAVKERDLAARLGMPIFYEREQSRIRQWLDETK